MNRVNMLLKDHAYQGFILRNRELEESRIYCRHTFEHTLDVARITYILMLENGSFSNWIRESELGSEHIGKELIYTAGILHDIGRWEEYETGESHALTSARYAVTIMEKYGYAPKEITMVTDAIKEHRGSCSPVTVLGRYLRIADRLSRLCFSCRARNTCKNIPNMETADGLIY